MFSTSCIVCSETWSITTLRFLVSLHWKNDLFCFYPSEDLKIVKILIYFNMFAFWFLTEGKFLTRQNRIFGIGFLSLEYKQEQCSTDLPAMLSTQGNTWMSVSIITQSWNSYANTDPVFVFSIFPLAGYSLWDFPGWRYYFHNPSILISRQES